MAEEYRPETMCISLGGSIISRRNGINVSYIRKFSRLLKQYSGRYRLIITVGGGYTSRIYIQSSKQFIKNNAVLDDIAIAITRINALIVKDLLSDLDVYPNIVTSLSELRMAASKSRIILMGGLLPGLSTDAVAVLASEVLGSKVIINVSREAYLYDRHPSEKGAKRLERLDHGRLIAIATAYDTREAGSNFLFDLMASKLAKRAGIEIRFVNDNINELRLALENKGYSGSLVKG